MLNNIGQLEIISERWFTYTDRRPYIPRERCSQWGSSGILKFWTRRSTFYQFFRCSPSAGPSWGWRLFGGIARDARRRGLNSPCISPYLGFRARSGCRRERGDLGGNERAEPPRCMARGSLSDECIYASHSPPILFGDKSDIGGTSRRKFIRGKTRPFSALAILRENANRIISSPVRFAISFARRTRVSG